ncbi:MFS transporter [Bacteriovorax sp. PP10]|uniref:MFS transporter n=1 Tax=Bacteriovorax antarcticus TaxID=3088717 RepID=A0ABU5VZJ3_9BACT|nr:MFS transporter [Bacteriovorax sp. PP10]MEA9358461.1 MFS transporter [Bacteriovorax sp. PP10]
MDSTNKARLILGLRGYGAMLFSIAASPVLYNAGISFKTISLGFGFLYVVLALFEIPTGIWADLFGAKKSSIIGGIIQALSLFLFLLAKDSTLIVISCFILYGIGSSFISGALSALLYASAKDQEKDKFNSSKYFSIIEKTSVASYILASASVGFLSKWLGLFSFSVAGIIYLIAVFIVAVSIHEEIINKTHKKLSEFINQAISGLKYIGSNKDLKILLPIRMLNQVETILGILWLPWIKTLGGSDLWFSVLATGSYLSRYAVNHYYSKKVKPSSYMPRIHASLLIMAVGASICALTSNVFVALIGVWIMAGARGIFLPATQAIQHDSFPDEIRSTGLSMMNFSVEAMIAISYFISSSWIDNLHANAAWWISMGAFLISVFLVINYKDKSNAN